MRISKSINLFLWRIIKPSTNNKLFDLHANMFIEDLRNGIIPYKNNDDIVTVSPNEACKKHILHLIRVSEYSTLGRQKFSNEILDFFDRVAAIMFQSGVTVFKVNREVSENDEASLTPLYPSQIIITPFCYYLKGFKDINGDYINKLVRYSLNDLWVLELPKEIGGSCKYISLLNKLSLVKNISPTFVNDILESNLKSGNIISDLIFDHTKYHDTANKLIIQLTRHIGWNDRDTSMKYSTEFYVVYKHTKFMYTQSIIREHILCQFNNLLFKVGLDCKVSIPGLQKSDEIFTLLEGMQKDPKIYQDVLNLVPLGGLK